MEDPLAQLGPAQFAELISRAPRTAWRPMWVRRLRHQLEEFCRFCWPDRFELVFNDLHRSLFRLQRIPTWRERAEDVRVAVAAPRGYAKSTIASFAALVHDIVYDREAFIVLMSATQSLSTRMSRDLRAQFLQPDSPLARMYGPFEVTGGVTEWEVSVQGRPSIAVIPKSFGTEVRGLKHPSRGIRPTLIVIDDGERKDRVRNPEQRKIWKEVLQKDVLKLGSRKGGSVVKVVGTVLHPDSMLANLMDDPGWAAERWKAILAWPTRADLWERCKQIWVDLTLGKHRRAAARAFFEANRRAMEEGAVLLDSSRTLFQLYELLWAEGLASFLSELQNEPVDPTSQIFVSDRFHRFRIVGAKLDHLEITTGPHRGRRIAIADLRKWAQWDPATGTPHGDFAAIAVVGRDEFGYSFVLDCWMQKAVPSVQLEAAWTLAERWNCTRMIVESDGFQKFVSEPYLRQRQERRIAGEFWKLQINGERAKGEKELRIATLEPDTTNGWLLFAEHLQPEVLQQFDQFPSADHDDGPDAIHGAWKKCGGRPAEMEKRAA